MPGYDLSMLKKSSHRVKFVETSDFIDIQTSAWFSQSLSAVEQIDAGFAGLAPLAVEIEDVAKKRTFGSIFHFITRLMALYHDETTAAYEGESAALAAILEPFISVWNEEYVGAETLFPAIDAWVKRNIELVDIPAEALLDTPLDEVTAPYLAQLKAIESLYLMLKIFEAQGTVSGIINSIAKSKAKIDINDIIGNQLNGLIKNVRAKYQRIHGFLYDQENGLVTRIKAAARQKAAESGPQGKINQAIEEVMPETEVIKAQLMGKLDSAKQHKEALVELLGECTHISENTEEMRNTFFRHFKSENQLKKFLNDCNIPVEAQPAWLITWQSYMQTGQETADTQASETTSAQTWGDTFTWAVSGMISASKRVAAATKHYSSGIGTDVDFTSMVLKVLRQAESTVEQAQQELDECQATIDEMQRLLQDYNPERLSLTLVTTEPMSLDSLEHAFATSQADFISKLLLDKLTSLEYANPFEQLLKPMVDILREQKALFIQQEKELQPWIKYIRKVRLIIDRLPPGQERNNLNQQCNNTIKSLYQTVVLGGSEMAQDQQAAPQELLAELEVFHTTSIEQIDNLLEQADSMTEVFVTDNPHQALWNLKIFIDGFNAVNRFALNLFNPEYNVCLQSINELLDEYATLDTDGDFATANTYIAKITEQINTSLSKATIFKGKIRQLSKHLTSPSSSTEEPVLDAGSEDVRLPSSIDMHS